MRLFRKSSNLKKQLSALEKTKRELFDQDIKNQKSTLTDLEALRDSLEMMHSFKINRFDHFYNLSIISSLANSDIIMFKHRVALGLEKMDKLLSARMLALVLVEYLQDMNDLLGNKLVKEMKINNFDEHIPKLNKLNSDFAAVRKKHGKMLTAIRNNIAAHKVKDGLKLLEYLFNIEIQELQDMANEINILNDEFSKESTKIIYTILDEARQKSEAVRSRL